MKKQTKVFFGVIVFIVLIFCNSCSDYLYEDHELKSIIGVNVTIEKKLYSCEKWGGIHGDGYIMNVYQLSDKAISDFLNNNALSNYPINKDNSLGVCKWQKTPIKIEFEEIKDIATRLATKDNELNSYMMALSDKLEKEGSYYSFYFNRELNTTNKIFFFMIDPKFKTFYVVSHKI